MNKATISWNRFIILSQNIALISDYVHNKIDLDIKSSDENIEVLNNFKKAILDFEAVTNKKIQITIKED